jgi:hypothetical protein
MDKETAGFRYSWNNAAIWRSSSDPFLRIMPLIDFRSKVVFRIWEEDGCGIMEMSFMVIAWVWCGGWQLKRIKLNRVNIIFIFK